MTIRATLAWTLSFLCYASYAELATAQEGTRWAVLIGVNDYANLQDLQYCSSDVLALKKQLVASGFPKDQIFLLHDDAKEAKYRPNRGNIERELALVLALAGKDDLVLVAFSGHGMHLDGTSYLCPTEAGINQPQNTMVSMEHLYKQMQRSQASLKLLVVDACRNDPRPNGQKNAKAKTDNRKLNQTFERPPSGILVLTSCGAGQVSYENAKLGRGVFMNFVLEALAGRADKDKNDNVSLMELYEYAAKQTKKFVARTYSELQVPALRGEINGVFELGRAKSQLEPEIVNSLKMRLKLIPAGDFLMGRTESESRILRSFDWSADKFQGRDETPAHRVQITKPFYMGIHEVTVGQFREFVNDTGYTTDAERDRGGGRSFINGDGDFQIRRGLTWRNPGFFQTDSHPVVQVSWKDANEFCDWLSQKEGQRYSLPTEAQWEYACRAGTETRYFNGDDPENLVTVANTRDATIKSRFPSWGSTLRGRDGYVYTAPVGSFRANPFGLHDMHGNVWEMCADWYSKSPYAQRIGRVTEDPEGPSSGREHVNRGGCFY